MSKFLKLYNLIMEDITSERKPIKKVDQMQPKEFIEFLKEFLPLVKDGKVDLNDVRISEKVDGCLDENTIIDTFEFGKISVKDLIEKFKTNKNIHIKGYDEILNEVIYTKLIETQVKDNINNWNLIELENGNTIILTDEHPVYLPKLKCYRKVCDLKENDIILFDK